MKYAKYIMRDPSICGGVPVIAGTHVPLRTVLASLAEGCSAADILVEFPTLTEDAICAVIAFAARTAEEDIPVQELPVFA